MGEDENHRLASLMDVLSALIENYEDATYPIWRSIVEKYGCLSDATRKYFESIESHAFMKIVFQSILLLVLPLFAVTIAYSCGCRPMSFEQKFARTGYVFVGTVTDISEDTKLKRMPHDSRRYFVRMKVLENFKGAPGKEIILSQYEIKKHNTSCPYFPLELNETYLIYASETSYPTWGNKVVRDIQHHTHCSPTQKFDASSPTYTALIDLKAKLKNKGTAVRTKRKKS